MRKIVLSLISLILLPLTVNAAVDGNTKTIGSAIADNANIKSLCQNAENENSGYTNATAGYYLECITIKCENSKNVHYIDNGFASKVKCENGNTNPKSTVVSSGADASAGQTLSLAKDASCAPDSAKLDSATGAYAFATRLYSYDCAYTADGSAYASGSKDDNNTTNPTTTTPTTSSNGNGNSNNPKTGVEDYYKILIPSIIVVSGALYLVNKKNNFKKI